MLSDAFMRLKNDLVSNCEYKKLVESVTIIQNNLLDCIKKQEQDLINNNLQLTDINNDIIGNGQSCCNLERSLEELKNKEYTIVNNTTVVNEPNTSSGTGQYDEYLSILESKVKVLEAKVCDFDDISSGLEWTKSEIARLTHYINNSNSSTGPTPVIPMQMDHSVAPGVLIDIKTRLDLLEYKSFTKESVLDRIDDVSREFLEKLDEKMNFMTESVGVAFDEIRELYDDQIGEIQRVSLI